MNAVTNIEESCPGLLCFCVSMIVWWAYVTLCVRTCLLRTCILASLFCTTLICILAGSYSCLVLLRFYTCLLVYLLVRTCLVLLRLYTRWCSYWHVRLFVLCLLACTSPLYACYTSTPLFLASSTLSIILIILSENECDNDSENSGRTNTYTPQKQQQ